MPITSALKEDNEKVTHDDPRLFNMSDLAKILGVPRAYITRMKHCGFNMPGGRSTVALAHKFLEGNPDMSPPEVEAKSE